MMRRRFLAASAASAVILASASSAAQPRIPDVALLMLVDTSSSISPEERRLQYSGHAVALRSLSADILGRDVVVSVAAWGEALEVVVPWTRLDSPFAIAGVADTLEQENRSTGNYTRVGDSLLAGLRLFEGVAALRRVIDISGDGEYNIGTSPLLVDTGDVVVNGLAVGENPEKFARMVQRGPGSFTLPASDFSVYPQVLRNKLALEIM